MSALTVVCGCGRAGGGELDAPAGAAVGAGPAPSRSSRRKARAPTRTSTDAPPAPWREGVESCDRTIDEFRVMLSKRPTAAPHALWTCLLCKTAMVPVVDWCRLCRAGRIRVSLAIAS